MKERPEATIAVTTRDRRDELRPLIESALTQTAAVEVLVIDDGSTDGTSDMVSAEYPQVVLERSETSLGLIEQRNRAATLAGGGVIVSIDDDARFTSPTTVEQTLRDFDHPRVGAVAIPFVDVRTSTRVLQEPPDRAGRWVTSSYIGTAHAVRRDVFLALGGYRGGLAQMVEEPDYCLRMLDRGFVTRLGRGDRIIHEESAKRDQKRITVLGRRNDILHGWHNVPMPYLLARLAKITAYSVIYPDARRHPGAVLRGLAMGYRDAWRARSSRDTVRRATYRLDHELRKRGPLLLSQIEDRLPALRA
jgi:glycosyltransferase involved in cell wall biosynthesis